MAAEPTAQPTPNQVVAYNLAQARTWKNWTQEEAAEHLEPFLGARRATATFSSAERSIDGQRVRQFTADDIVAFSRGFGLPVGFFFLPPPPSAAPLPIRLASKDNPYWVSARPNWSTSYLARPAISGSWRRASRSSSARLRSICRATHSAG